MRMYQDERRLDFHALGREIKRKREAKGWTQEYLAQLVDRTPRSIMYFENRGQHPSLNTFYKIVTLLDISVDQFFYPDKQNEESDSASFNVKNKTKSRFACYSTLLYAARVVRTWENHRQLQRS